MRCMHGKEEAAAFMMVWNDWDESMSVPAQALLRMGAEEEGGCQDRVD